MLYLISIIIVLTIAVFSPVIFPVLSSVMDWINQIQDALVILGCVIPLSSFSLSSLKAYNFEKDYYIFYELYLYDDNTHFVMDGHSYIYEVLYSDEFQIYARNTFTGFYYHFNMEKKECKLLIELCHCDDDLTLDDLFTLKAQ
jgi:hypothetical protein